MYDWRLRLGFLREYDRLAEIMAIQSSKMGGNTDVFSHTAAYCRQPGHSAKPS